MKPLVSTTPSPRQVAAIGVVAATLTVGGTVAGCATGSAEADTTVVAAEEATVLAAPEDARAGEQPDPLELPGADEYTQERADAFWAAGYSMEDADALAELWQVPILEAKGRAGQLVLDGQPVPVAPGSTLDLTDPETIAVLAAEAYWDAGYTHEDGEKLAELWDVDVYEAKATGGRLLLEGQALPVPPSGTPAS